MSTDKRQPSTTAIDALSSGTLTIVGRIESGSNFTFLVDVDHEGQKSQAIYKPYEGEQPLWDFPDGIYKREVAAYQLSAALGWPNIPETIVREEAPYGVGSLQRFVPSDFSQHYFTLVEQERYHSVFKTIATFDFVANNADRKAGHCILSDAGDIYAIDNALCFNAEPKLRTVIWEFGGEAVDADALADLTKLAASLPASLVGIVGERRSCRHHRTHRVVDSRSRVAGARVSAPVPLAVDLVSASTSVSLVFLAWRGLF